MVLLMAGCFTPKRWDARVTPFSWYTTKKVIKLCKSAFSKIFQGSACWLRISLSINNDLKQMLRQLDVKHAINAAKLEFEK